MQYQRDLYDAMVKLFEHMLRTRAKHIADESKADHAALRKFKQEMDTEWLWSSTYGSPAKTQIKK